MERYDYHDWIQWPEADVREYAQEIAENARLTAQQTAYLARRMADEAGYWDLASSEGSMGPQKLGERAEEFIRLDGSNDAAIFEINVKINRPRRPADLFEQDVIMKAGAGLTTRHWRETVKASNYIWKKYRVARRNRSRHPFRWMRNHIRQTAERARWTANWYPIERNIWLASGTHAEPYEGVAWYAETLEVAYMNATNQAQLNSVEGAMWHAFRVGQLLADLEIRLSYADSYDKSMATRRAMLEGAKAGAAARRLAADEERIAAIAQKMRENDSLSAIRAIHFVAMASPHLGSKDTIARAWKKRRKMGQP